jgi:hypothetical protein
LTEQSTAEERFAALVAELVTLPGVTPPVSAAGSRRSFGSEALKVDGKIFAMLVDGRLVVKLPHGRVEALTAAGTGHPFDSGGGRVMREWLSVAPAQALAAEAMRFVAPKC